jgi:predicted transcriptional regulator
MDIQLEKYKIIEWITSLKDKTMISRLKSLKEESRDEDWWDHLSPAEQEGILKGLEDIENGNTIPHEEVMKKMKKRVGL